EVYKNALGRALYRQQQTDVNEVNQDRLQQIAQGNPDLRDALDQDPEVRSLEKSRAAQVEAQKTRDAAKPWLGAKPYREFQATVRAGTGEIRELSALMS